MRDLIIVVLICIIIWLSFLIAKMQRNIANLEMWIEKIRQRVVDIDPQFNDERQLVKDFEDGRCSGYNHADLIKLKESQNKPTIFNPFS